MTVLDASAVLGLLMGEERAAPVIGYLDAATMSSVNHAEVVGKLGDVGMSAEIADGLVRRLNVSVVPFGEQHAVVAGELKPMTAHLGLSLGDRACLATALLDGQRIVTLDRVWAGLDIGVPIVVLEGAGGGVPGG